MERTLSTPSQLPEEATGFPPLMCENPKILILGTIPGKSSINAGEYYHDGSNRLWKVIADISGEEVPTDYCSKKSMLARHGIVLWDYYQKVTRVDSSDNGILSGVQNNIPQFLIDNPSIHTVAVLGYGKWKLFGEMLKHFCDTTDILSTVRVLRLPETSGLNARWDLSHLCEHWKCIFE